MKKTKTQLFVSIFELVVGLLAIGAFILMTISHEKTLKWIGTLLLAIGLMIMGIAGIVSYRRDKDN